MHVGTTVRGQTASTASGRPFSPSQKEHQDIFNSAILQLGEDLQSVLGALTTVTGPDPENVPGALDRDGHRHLDRRVGNLVVYRLGHSAPHGHPAST